MSAIDTHAHFWDVDAFRYPWIDKGSVFDRTYSLEDYQRASAEIPISRIVFVECDAHPECSLSEVKWIERLAATDRRIQGIVAHAQLTSNNHLGAELDILASMPIVKGVRHNIQNNPAGFSVQTAFVHGVKEAHLRGFHFELCLKHQQLGEAIELVKQCPEVRFVLDHCAKPDIRAGGREPWLSQLHEIATMPNVVCKISGLVTEANWETWKPDEVLWYAQMAGEAFGPSRIMFGSDWPVNEVAGGLLKWFRLAEALAAPWSTLNRHKFFYENAEAFYRLNT
jgi:L-fuconolactonase